MYIAGNKLLCFSIFHRPDTPESWRFAHVDVIPAVGIMAFGKLTSVFYCNIFVKSYLPVINPIQCNNSVILFESANNSDRF